MKMSKTTTVKVFRSDLEDIRRKFPEVRMADFFHMSIKTNPFLQAEALLRKNDKK